MKVFLDTNVWLSATVLVRKFPHVPQALALFDSIWCVAAITPDVADPADDPDARLVRAAQAAGASVFIAGDRRVLGWSRQGDMQLLSPRDAWTQLFAQNGTI